MLNDILNAVTRRLSELFGENYTIYTDKAGQEFRKPCFFVRISETSERPMIGRRYFRRTGIAVQYLAIEESSREENQVLDILMEGMEAITLENGRQLTGTNRKSGTEEGIATFYVNYDQFIVKEKEETPMEELEMKGGIV